jgi:exosortase
MPSSAASRFAALCVVPLIVEWKPILKTLELASNNEEFTHILLILPVVVTLIVIDWNALAHQSESGHRFGGSILVVAALAAITGKLAGFTPDVQRSIAMLAVALWWIGSFVFCFGVRLARSLVFPLCFLLWIIPFPDFLLDRVVVLLQQGSAASAEFLFRLSGVPLLRDGLTLAIPGVTLEVAKECSSIRSSLLLVVTTMVLAHLFLYSPWRKLVIVAISLPLSVAKNGLRIFVIGVLGTRVDPSYMTGSFHHQGGWIFLAVALVVVFLLIWILRLGEEQTKRPDTSTMQAGAARGY